MTWQIQSTNLEDTSALAKKIAQLIEAPRVLNLIGDLGAGKTTFTKGLAKYLGCSEDVSSPSFTIMQKYVCSRGIELHHYDFYRLNTAGVQMAELQESINNPNAVTVIEWAEAVGLDLPDNSVKISFAAVSDTERKISVDGLEEVN